MPSSDSSSTTTSQSAAFLADDTLVEVIPAFDLDRAVPLFSTTTTTAITATEGVDDNGKPTKTKTPTTLTTAASSFGPVRAGIPTEVPLWLAALLSEKSLAKVVMPRWMEVDHLVKVLQEERRSTSLVGSSSTKKNDDDNDDNTDHATSSSTILELPFYYYEINQRLSKLPASSISWNRSEVSLLVEDIGQVRIDKLRRTFQASMANLSNDAKVAMLSSSNDKNKPLLLPDTFAEVTGMGATELAQLGPFFLQALNDVTKLEGRLKAPKKKKKNKDGQQDGSQQPAPMDGDGDRGSSSNRSRQDPTSSSSPPPQIRRRDRLRRFR